jgi:hypothetical protein
MKVRSTDPNRWQTLFFCKFYLRTCQKIIILGECIDSYLLGCCASVYLKLILYSDWGGYHSVLSCYPCFMIVGLRKTAKSLWIVGPWIQEPLKYDAPCTTTIRGYLLVWLISLINLQSLGEFWIICLPHEIRYVESNLASFEDGSYLWHQVYFYSVFLNVIG